MMNKFQLFRSLRLCFALNNYKYCIETMKTSKTANLFLSLLRLILDRFELGKQRLGGALLRQFHLITAVSLAHNDGGIHVGSSGGGQVRPWWCRSCRTWWRRVRVLDRSEFGDHVLGVRRLRKLIARMGAVGGVTSFTVHCRRSRRRRLLPFGRLLCGCVRGLAVMTIGTSAFLRSARCSSATKTWQVSTDDCNERS